MTTYDNAPPPADWAVTPKVAPEPQPKPLPFAQLELDGLGDN
jgi:hypothetical protein